MKQDWPETDRSRIGKLRERNASAWIWFSETYSPIIVRILRGLGLGQHDAEDVAQAVFEKMLKANYNGTGLFRWFLLTTVRNACVDHLRRTRRQPVGTGETAMMDFLECQPDREHEHAFEDEYQKQMLVAAQADVRPDFSDKHWEVFERINRGEDRNTVATSLGMTPGNTRVIETRIRKRLKARIEVLENNLETTILQACRQ